ncbi:MAG TPA: SIS domain-containing protein [Desulfomonilaceae bacterium]|nr:SIS domain-containing protein [Desulfomonilaceae bacterium]
MQRSPVSELEKIFKNANGSATEYARAYTDHLMSVLTGLDFEAVGRVIDLFRKVRAKGNTIFFLGNGGSAATAAHFANDLGFSASPEGKTPIRSLSLTCNSSFLTCLANDIGYENVFTWQLKNLMRPGDVVVAISASGNSPNAVNALEYAGRCGGIPVAFVGFDGGKLKDLAEYCVHVNTNKGEYGPVEDVHLVLDHLISTFLAFDAQ